MKISHAIFVKSASRVADCPKSDKPEFAFIGRSNVGKSSFINTLCNNGRLAKTSATPGKTQLINHFMINNSWFLVDLPGYGFAKTGKGVREGLTTIIHDYCLKRPNLRCLFILLDSRLKLQQIDREFLLWCAEHSIPFAIVYTKTDKLSRKQVDDNVRANESELLRALEELPNTFLTSSKSKAGREDVLDFIDFQLKHKGTE